MYKECKVCGNSLNNKPYIVREMMFGFRDEFEYFQCSNCKCLQIDQIPENLDKYYPDNYYSFTSPKISRQNKYLWLLRRQRTLYYLGKKSILGNILVKLFGEPHLPSWMKDSGLNVDSKILDVGCGVGDLLINFQTKGFSNLTGFDPYIKEDCHYENRVRVLKRSLYESSESFDFIMLHHSFEHMSDPIKTFKKLNERTTASGVILLRIPVITSFAWRKYKTNWAQLDAPRHFFLHSFKSIELLSKRAGFEIVSVEYDSDAFQFWGSEQIIKDIPLYDRKSYINGLDNSIFTKKDIKAFKTKAEELNLANDGDQACFLLRKQKS